MAFFTNDFHNFFKGLRSNNDRDWFNANKKEYIKSVKEPFEEFVGHMIEHFKPLMPNLLITPKDAIFRIYRDTRFSKDKTPYKEHVSAIISPGGRKDMTATGVYVQMNDEELRLYSGMYMPEKAHLSEIRNHIAAQPEVFRKLYTEKNFVSKFVEIRGEKNKRLPKELTEAAEKEPLIYNKGFYYFAKLPAKYLLKDNLPSLIEEYYHAAKPLNDFFEAARP